jgi:hypothetical protein
MKNRLLGLSAILLISISLKAQKDTTTHIKELGIGLTSTTSFNLNYEWGTQKTLFRFSASSLSFTEVPTPDNGETKVGATIKFTILKAKRITDKFDFIWGPFIGAGVQSNTSTAVSPFAGIALGARVALGKSFFVYAEIDPDLYLNATINSETTSVTSYGISSLSTSGATIIFVYRWSKK